MAAVFNSKTSLSGRLNNGTIRSLPASPALAATSASPRSEVTPTSAPEPQDWNTQRMQALRIPVIHLLAVRPVSEKFVAHRVCCTQTECRGVLDKVGRPARLDVSKWDLVDRSFKELDPWKFPYPSDNDRELAIDHAISAYDRMRLSREDKLWQTLLQKSERGKGKILSRLNLHGGPIPQHKIPTISVPAVKEPAGENQDDTKEDGENQLRPSVGQSTKRSVSHDRVKKKKVSEKEAQSNIKEPEATAWRFKEQGRSRNSEKAFNEESRRHREQLQIHRICA